MTRFPELLQFRAASGTAVAIESAARQQGKKPADVIREAVESHVGIARPAVLHGEFDRAA